MKTALKVWSIGEVRDYYTKLVGKEEADEAFSCDFTERDLSEEREFDFDGEKKTMSLAQLLEHHANTEMPNQISTSYN